MLFGGGIVGLVNGVGAFRYDDRQADLVLAERNLELWGGASLVVGTAVLAAGIGAFYGKGWARWTGIAVALMATIGNVARAEIQPTQSLIGALICVSVVYGLATHPVDVELRE
jgi:hypothetical protein